MSSDTGTKKLFVSISNPYYKILLGEKFGKFTDNKNDELYKSIIYASFYDIQTHFLFLGDQEGFLSCFDLREIYKIFNSKLKDNELYKLVHEILINNIYRVSGHKQGIVNLYVPLNIYPEIIISTSTDQEVSLFSINNGQYIDTLKQEVNSSNPVPIAIQFMDNNPFLEKIQENKNKNNNEDENEEYDFIVRGKKRKYKSPSTKIIYRSQIENSLDKKNNSKNDNSSYTNIYQYSTQVMENNAKEKLLFLIRGLKLRKNCSTTWKYNIDLNHLEKVVQNEYNIISDIVKKKEDQTVKTEILFQNMSIFSGRYYPIFIKNLTEEEKDEFYGDIQNKIRSIKVSINKSKVTKVEKEEIEKIEKKSSRAINPKSRNNIFLTPISPLNSNDKEFNLKNIKSSSTTELPILKKNLSVSTNPSDKRFDKFQQDFNKRILELNSPILELIHKKRLILKKSLPKIITTVQSSDGNEQ